MMEQQQPQQETQGLIDRARNGDRAAFSELTRMHMKPIVALTYRMTGDRDTAFDLAQETFLAAWQNLAGFRGDSRFESWLYRIATNKTLNYLKANKDYTKIDMDERVPADTATPDQEYTRKQLREDVFAFMKMLPTQQRIVFNLRFYRQLQFNEIAETIGSAVGTVKTHYREALKKLREFAVEKGWDR